MLFFVRLFESWLLQSCVLSLPQRMTYSGWDTGLEVSSNRGCLIEFASLLSSWFICETWVLALPNSSYCDDCWCFDGACGRWQHDTSTQYLCRNESFAVQVVLYKVKFIDYDVLWYLIMVWFRCVGMLLMCQNLYNMESSVCKYKARFGVPFSNSFFIAPPWSGRKKSYWHQRILRPAKVAVVDHTPGHDPRQHKSVQCQWPCAKRFGPPSGASW